MATKDDIEKLRKNSEPQEEYDPPRECVFCCKRETLWDGIVKQGYETKIGRKIKPSKPCIHHKDSWLVWSTDTAGFICASITDNGEKSLPDNDELFTILENKERMLSLFQALYKKWMNHSMWLYVCEKDRKRME